MEKIKENLNYITSLEDTDKEKFEKIFKKMNENNIEFSCIKYEVDSILEGHALGEIHLTLGSEVFALPFLIEVTKFNYEIHRIILEKKKIILFEKLGILPRVEERRGEVTHGGASPKQISFIRDKMKYQDSRTIVESKLKEFSKTLENISKDEASAIITTLGRK